MKFFDITFIGPDEKLHGFAIAAFSKEHAKQLFSSTGCEVIMVVEVTVNEEETSPLSASTYETQTNRDRRGANKW